MSVIDKRLAAEGRYLNGLLHSFLFPWDLGDFLMCPA